MGTRTTDPLSIVEREHKKAGAREGAPYRYPYPCRPVQSSSMSDEAPSQAELALREYLLRRLENAASPRGVHLYREELTQWAASRDDTTAEEAVRLFERGEGTVWFGERVEGGERFGWNTAWLTEVR